MPPTGRSTVSLMFPLTGPAVQLPPPMPTHVHVAPVRAVGTVSVTVAPVAGAGPLFVATIV